MTMVELNEKALEVGQRVEKYTGEARWFGTILSTYTTGRGKVRHVVEVEPQGFQMIAVPEQLRPAPALPAPDGLVERLLEAADDWRRLSDPENEELTLVAAAVLQSQAKQIERLTSESQKEAWGRIAAEQQVQKLTAENERLKEALTPSGHTKAAYAGEFHMGITLYAGGEEEYRRVMIPWTTIKEIMAMIRARSALETQEGGK